MRRVYSARSNSRAVIESLHLYLTVARSQLYNDRKCGDSSCHLVFHTLIPPLRSFLEFQAHLRIRYCINNHHRRGPGTTHLHCHRRIETIL